MLPCSCSIDAKEKERPCKIGRSGLQKTVFYGRKNPALYHSALKAKHQKDDPEGFQRAIGKPFGRARRRETSGGNTAYTDLFLKHLFRMRQKDFASAEASRGLCGHRRSAFDFRLRRTRHWRGVALWKPSVQTLCCYAFNAAQYYASRTSHTAASWGASSALISSAVPSVHNSRA